jgi:DNA-binding MarR family transcriptional regulator
MPTGESARAHDQLPVRGVDLHDPVELARAQRIGRAWREIRRGSAAMAVREYMYGAERGALELGDVDTLDLLVQRDEWRMSDLATALRVDPSTATRAVQRLVTRDMASRRTYPDDGRVVLVQATKTGHNRHRAIAKRRSVAFSHILADFEPDERDLLAAMMERFVAALDHLVADLDD